MEETILVSKVGMCEVLMHNLVIYDFNTNFPILIHHMILTTSFIFIHNLVIYLF
jgi:hypothetical protein